MRRDGDVVWVAVGDLKQASGGSNTTTEKKRYRSSDQLVIPSAYGRKVY